MYKAILLSVVCIVLIQGSQAFGVPKEWRNASSIDFNYWKSKIVPTYVNKTECVFFRNENIFSCSGNSSVSIQCPASLSFKGLDEKLFYSFGIGLNKNESFSDMSLQVYHLYPKLFKSDKYMSYFVTLEGVQSSFCLVDSSKVERSFYGLKIEKSDCFNELRSFFFRVNRYESVKVASYLLEKPIASIVSNVYII